MKCSDKGMDRQTICVIYVLDLCAFGKKKIKKAEGTQVLSSRRREYNCAALFECEMCSGTRIGF
jgi:hypothetical protein